jgi:hypothetical protein
MMTKILIYGYCVGSVFLAADTEEAERGYRVGFAPKKPWKSPCVTRQDDFPNPRPPTDSADEAKSYAEKYGPPSLTPGIYFRALLIEYLFRRHRSGAGDCDV